MTETKAKAFREELIDLITDALSEFGHDRCPYCQSYIALEKYITEKDIENWLKSREVKNEKL